jgi:hypothetical protein
MSKRVELILVTLQEIVIFLREKLIIVGVLMVVRVRYNEPKFYQ